LKKFVNCEAKGVINILNPKKMKNLKIVYLSLLILAGNAVVAQGSIPPGPKPPPVGLPIDTILWVLGIIAVGYGIYMLKKRSAKSAL